MDALIEMLNKSFYKSRLDGYYSSNGQSVAEKAYAKFYKFLMTVPAVEREAILQAIVPGSDKTLVMYLTDAKEFCVTGTSQGPAKLIYQYRPDTRFPVGLNFDKAGIERKYCVPNNFYTNNLHLVPRSVTQVISEAEQALQNHWQRNNGLLVR